LVVKSTIPVGSPPSPYMSPYALTKAGRRRPPSSPPSCHPRVWMNARDRFVSATPGRSTSKRDWSCADGAVPRGAHDQLPGSVPLNRIDVDERTSPSYPLTSPTYYH